MRVFRTLTKGQVKRGRSNNYILPVAALAGLILLGQSMWLKENRYMFLPFSTTRIECEYCKGTGIVLDYRDRRAKVMCPSCLGVGHNTVRRFDEEDAICIACGGMGRNNLDGTWGFCERCGGRGIYRVHDWRTIADVETVDVRRMEDGGTAVSDSKPADVPRDMRIMRDPLNKQQQSETR